MRAQAGDWLVIKETYVDRPDQRGRILEVRGADGAPPYLVKWLRDDRESLYFPGPDAQLVTAEQQSEIDEEERRRLATTRAAIHHR
ncbi:DUF1918 domain-containing protein [Amycolatopsis anabasis]|uniref:DUF1918 domain-containing protein n=1 Tax=Amycolatopsis anabasis TaxID=1840409 RepID=UPI00131D7424|nr:DUF1918 domain-containing protein [Amycolatopsis anabasis]